MKSIKLPERSIIMKYAAMAVLLAAGLFVVETPAQMAIKWMGSDGWGLGTRYESLFNQYNLQVVNGTIYSIDTVTPFSGMSRGIQIVLRTQGSGDLPIHLGPSWFVQHQDMNLSPNDQVEVRGARFSLNGKSVMAAFEVYRAGDSKILLLRDQDDIPYWCGWRKKK
jgi:hypothetical protein